MKLPKLISNPIYTFFAYFIVTFLAIYMISLTIDSAFTGLFVTQGNSYFESAINTEFKYNRRVKITKREENGTQIHLQIVFQDKRNPNGTLLAKDIYSDLRNEALLPLIFLISLIISTPIPLKRKLASLFIGVALMFAYIYFKLYLFAYDNYSHPEYTLLDLSQPISGIVFFGNKFLEVTGASTNVIVPVVIWLLSSWSEELLNLLNINRLID